MIRPERCWLYVLDYSWSPSTIAQKHWAAHMLRLADTLEAKHIDKYKAARRPS